MQPMFLECDTKDSLLSTSAENNILVRKYFNPLTNAFDAYNGKFNPNAPNSSSH